MLEYKNDIAMYNEDEFNDCDRWC